eukprot:gene11754-15728_t
MKRKNVMQQDSDHKERKMIKEEVGSLSSSTPLSSISSLQNWLQHNNVKGVNNISMKLSPLGSLGCFSNINYAVGDTIFEIPRKSIFGINSTCQTKLTEFVKDCAEKLNCQSNITSEFLIWLHMIHYREDSNNHFYNYFNSLDHVSPSLLSWSSSSLYLQSIKNTNLGNSLIKYKETLENQYKIIEDIRRIDPIQSEIYINSKVFNFDALVWAKGHYLARRYPGHFEHDNHHNLINNNYREIGLQNIGSLVPLLDILNHNNEYDWLKLQVDGDNLLVICNHPINQ